jgi:aminoglycoside phosphotransferase
VHVVTRPSLAEAAVDGKALVEMLNGRGLGPFTPLGSAQGGESGQPAYLLAGADGRRFVLKWRPGDRDVHRWQAAARATAVLRRRGYPAAACVRVEATERGSYMLQEELPGDPLAAFRAEHVPAVLRLNALQAGAATEAGLGSDCWPAPVAEPVLHGGDGFCIIETLRRHSAETAALLVRLQALATAALDDAHPQDDIVHFDFNPANLLEDGGAISGVIDWDGVCAGDRAFDLATALFYGYGDAALREALWAALLDIAHPRVAALYLAHLILRQVDWSLRKHSAAEAARWLSRAQAVLADVARITR